MNISLKNISQNELFLERYYPNSLAFGHTTHINCYMKMELLTAGIFIIPYHRITFILKAKEVQIS